MPRLGDGLRCVTFRDSGGVTSCFERNMPYEAYVPYGAGVPLFLAPGLGLDGRSMAPLAALPDSRRVALWNFPNELPPPGADGLATLADLYLAHAARCGMPDRFVMGGSSLGGTIALAAALRAPERAAGLVLFAGSAAWRDLGTLLRLGPALHRVIPRRPFPRIFARILFGAAGRSPTCDDLRMQALHRTKAHVGAVIALLHAPGPFDMRGRCAALRTPTLLFHDPGDRIVPIAASRAVSAASAAARVVETPDAGHLPFLGDPERCVAELSRWLP